MLILRTEEFWKVFTLLLKGKKRARIEMNHQGKKKRPWTFVFIFNHKGSFFLPVCITAYRHLSAVLVFFCRCCCCCCCSSLYLSNSTQRKTDWFMEESYETLSLLLKMWEGGRSFSSVYPYELREDISY